MVIFDFYFSSILNMVGWTCIWTQLAIKRNFMEILLRFVVWDWRIFLERIGLKWHWTRALFKIYWNFIQYIEQMSRELFCLQTWWVWKQWFLVILEVFFRNIFILLCLSCTSIAAFRSRNLRLVFCRYKWFYLSQYMAAFFYSFLPHPHII